MNIKDYTNADFKIVALNEIKPDGTCGCDDDDCEVVGKHPRQKNWSVGIPWTDNQLEFMTNTGQFKTGFGALCEGRLIIDIDPRNGGLEAYEKLVNDTGIDFKQESGFVVKTGGGGWHIYFNAPSEIKMATKVKQYKGLDFKSSGFVVACGSMHASGKFYETESGHPSSIGDAPQKLIELLDKKNYITNHEPTGGSYPPVDDTKIGMMLSYLSPDMHYDEWITVGMAIHHETQGTGFELWDAWSKQSTQKYHPSKMRAHWNSFGKSTNPITIGSLKKMAQENGYSDPIVFHPYPVNLEETKEIELPSFDLLDTSWVDVSRPPGIIGEMARHMQDSAYREDKVNLSIGAALYAASVCWGMQYQPKRMQEEPNTEMNLFIFTVAPSATGKNHFDTMIGEYMTLAGVQRAMHKNFKSEQEIVRNMIAHQLSAYVIDEWGLTLKKIDNPKGNTSYLAGISPLLMTAFSNFGKPIMASKEVIDSQIDSLKSKLAACEKQKSESINVDINNIKIERYKEKLIEVDTYGIPSGYLALYGGTTPETFDELADHQRVKSGFLGRALIFEDKNSAPKTKYDRVDSEIPDNIKYKFIQIATAGHSDPLRDPVTGEIYFKHDRAEIPYDENCPKAFKQVSQYFDTEAERESERPNGGLEAIPLRAKELFSKVAWLLALGDGQRLQLKHIQWAFELIKRDTENKLSLVRGNVSEENKDKPNELLSKLQNKMSKEEGLTVARAANRLKKFTKEHIEKGLNYLVETGVCRKETGRSTKYFLK